MAAEFHILSMARKRNELSWLELMLIIRFLLQVFLGMNPDFVL